MAKHYKARKKCSKCKKIFFPTYSGTMYCPECKGVKNDSDKRKDK